LDTVLLSPCPYRGGERLKVWTSLSAPARYAHLKVFTPANRLVAFWSLGDCPVGRQSRDLDDKDLSHLANGLYYVVLEVPHGRVLGKWVVFR
jgi:hypothetical protein